MPAPMPLIDPGFARGGSASPSRDVDIVAGDRSRRSASRATRSGQRAWPPGSSVSLVLLAADRPIRLADPAMAPAPWPATATGTGTMNLPPSCAGFAVRAPSRASSAAHCRRIPARVLGATDRSAPARDPGLACFRIGTALWVRRLVRRAWLALAVVVLAELALWTVARFVPLPAAPVDRVRRCRSSGLLGWLVAGDPGPTRDRRDGAARWTSKADSAIASPAPSSLPWRSRRLPDRSWTATPATRLRCRLARRGGRDRSIRPPPAGDALAAARMVSGRPVLRRACRARPRPASSWRPLLLAPVPAPAEPPGRGHRPAAADRGSGRATGGTASTGSPKISNRVARTPTIRARSSPRSSGSWRCACGSGRTSSTSTWRAWARSRTRFARRSIRPTSSGQRRWRRSAAPCHAPPRASRMPTATAIPR